MGIIGVVAALTLPNLNSSTGEKEKVSKLQKIYSNLQDAFGRAEAVYGPFDEWFINDNTIDKREKRMFDRMTEFLKYSKACTVTDCTAVFDKGGTSGGDGSTTTKYSVILADGSTVGFMYKSYPCALVDIDGLNKGPNTAGKDFFEFCYNTEENKFSHNLYGIRNNYTGQIHSEHKSSGYAAAWVIINGNMDYLKVDNDGKCPDGKTVLDWTTNTTCK